MGHDLVDLVLQTAVIQELPHDLLAGALCHGLLHISAAVVGVQTVEPHEMDILRLVGSHGLQGHVVVDKPRRVHEGGAAALAGGVAGLFRQIVKELGIVPHRHGAGDEVALVGVEGELLGMAVLRALGGQLFPQREAALVNGVTVHHGSLGHAALCGVLGHGAVGEENKILFRDGNDLLGAALTDMQRRDGLVDALDPDVHIRDRRAGDEVHAVIGQIDLQRTDQAVVLVVLGAQDAPQALDEVKLVHEAHSIAAHLDQAVIGLEGQHGAPVVPELALEERRAEPLLDGHIFQLIFLRQHHLDHLLLDLRGHAHGGFIVGLEALRPQAVLGVDLQFLLHSRVSSSTVRPSS